MTRRYYKYIFMGCFLLFGRWSNAVYGQTTINKTLNDRITAIKNVKERLPIEKLYLQTDKPDYVCGDTIRFKAYLLDADFLLPSTRSGLLYVELDDLAGMPVKQIMVPVSHGLSWGNIPLNLKEYPDGNYTLRAYTNWMRNFEEDYIYQKNIYITGFSEHTLIRPIFKYDSIAGKNKLYAKLYFFSGLNYPLRFKNMKLLIMHEGHTLATDKLATNIDGILDFSFNFPAKNYLNALVIKVKQTDNGSDSTTLTIPVNLNRPAYADLQFMPEGGHIVAGIHTKIGFKCIGENGYAMPVSGKIYNNKQQEITTFKSLHAGMGSFELDPQPNESYTAKVFFPDATTKDYVLPPVSPTGTTLTVKSLNSDSLTISVNTSENGNYYIIGQSRGLVCYAQAISINSGHLIKNTIAKSLFPTGIARFTLLNAANQPQNERQVFINHNDNLQITIKTSKQYYSIRDSVAVSIEVKDKDGNPVRGSFSVAATDDGQVRTDSTGNNILSTFLLTSDLQGNIENPNYYFYGNKAAELDNLLLTQGWVGYSWKDIISVTPKIPYYQPEKDFEIKGTVTNFKKSLKGTKIILFSNHPPIIKDTVTDNAGHFCFTGIIPIDTALFKLQAVSPKGKILNVFIKGDEFEPPKFKPWVSISPWYIYSDTVLRKNAPVKISQFKTTDTLTQNMHRLKEVVIKGQKIIPGSKNLNGPGQYDFAFDEKEMEKANKMTLGDFLEKKIKGYVVTGIWEKSCDTCKPIPWDYVLSGKRIRFIFDGLDLEYGYTFNSLVARWKFIKSYLDYFTAEDITGIEVLYNDKFTSNYNMEHLSINEVTDFGTSYVYLEITTRDKKGPFMRKTPGTYLYKTLPFTTYKEFYQPKYRLNNKAASIGTDLRSTIFWAPNIITDVSGKATFSFYSADKPGNYSLIIEGTDLNGQLGSARQKIKISSSPSK